MKKLTKIMLGTAGIVVATGVGFGVSTAAIASQAPAEPTVGEDVISEQAEYAAKYLEAREGLEFPSTIGARSAPEDTVPVLAEGWVAEAGVPAGRANHEWLCAWEAEYLDATATGDTARATEALDVIQTWETLPWVTENVVDPERGWYNNVVVPALAGDPSGIEEDHAPCG